MHFAPVVRALRLNVGSHRLWAIVSAPLFALFVCGWLFFLIQKGLLTNKDEFMTAERSREMLLLGPLAVHENFHPFATALLRGR
jgi:hypothetical protein